MNILRDSVSAINFRICLHITRIFIFLLIVVFPGSSFAQVLIVEVQYNSVEESRNQGEWLEIYNQSENEVDLSGWTIRDGGSGYGVFQFPHGTIISPFSPVLIANELDGFQSEYPGVVPDFVTVGGNCIEKSTSTRCLQMHNTNGDSLTLKDNAGVDQDSVSWEPPEADEGESICRNVIAQQFVVSGDNSDWSSSCVPHPGTLPFSPPEILSSSPIPVVVSTSDSRSSGGQNALVVQMLRETGTAYAPEVGDSEESNDFWKVQFFDFIRMREGQNKGNIFSRRND